MCVLGIIVLLEHPVVSRFYLSDPIFHLMEGNQMGIIRLENNTSKLKPVINWKVLVTSHCELSLTSSCKELKFLIQNLCLERQRAFGEMFYKILEDSSVW